jgi:simple sugar transport system ATP-binding protein
MLIVYRRYLAYKGAVKGASLRWCDPPRGADVTLPATERTSVAIAGQQLAKRFGHVNALVDASISVRPGQIVALFGDNGAGKSTLLRCLLGLERPDAGRLIIADRPVTLATIKDAQACGVEGVHQDLALAPDLSPIDNMFLGRELTMRGLLGHVGTLDRRRMGERANAALKDLSITLPSLRVPIRHLSGGQRQAVAVARAVMWATTAVLLDEPTAALGARQSEIVCDLMRTVAQRGLGVLVVSHDLPRMLAVADRVVILWRGRTVVDTVASDLRVPEAVAIMVGYQEQDAS